MLLRVNIELDVWIHVLLAIDSVSMPKRKGFYDLHSRFRMVIKSSKRLAQNFDLDNWPSGLYERFWLRENVLSGIVILTQW